MIKYIPIYTDRPQVCELLQRIFNVGRDVWKGHLVQLSLLKEGHLSAGVVQDHDHSLQASYSRAQSPSQKIFFFLMFKRSLLCCSLCPLFLVSLDTT